MAYRSRSKKSRRERSGKKPGAQEGHDGSNMTIPHEPDVTIQHLRKLCQQCPHLCSCKESGNFACTESRYVVDVVITTNVTEHQTVHPVHCPFFEVANTARFPENVTAYVQYGSSVTVLVSLLSTFGSFERIHDLLNGLLDVQISTGTLVNMVRWCAETIEPTLQEIRTRLMQNPVNHYDETGIRVNGTLHWVHNSSSANYTYQTIHKKRGQEGIDDNGVIGNSSGVHDCWGSYWKYGNVDHAVCGAHLLRELDVF